MPHLVGFLGRYCINDSPLEAHHGLINRQLSVGSVGCPKVGNEWVKQGSELVEGIMTLLPFRNVVSVVVEVEESNGPVVICLCMCIILYIQES